MLNESMKQYPCPTFKFNTITSGKNDNLGTEQEQSGHGKKVLVCEIDGLRDQGYSMALRMQKQGCKV